MRKDDKKTNHAPQPSAKRADPFVKETINGKLAWRKSPQLRAVYEDLKLRSEHIENIRDKEIQGAYLALFSAGARVRHLLRGGENLDAIREPEYVSDHRVGREEGVSAITDFLMPLAHRLNITQPENGAKWEWHPQNQADAERLKRKAVKWLETVIDHTFPKYLMGAADVEVRRALDLIPIALAFCRKHDQMPTKKELFSLACESEAWHWQGVDGLHSESKRTLWRAAGLDDLPRAKRGKSKK